MYPSPPLYSVHLCITLAKSFKIVAEGKKLSFTGKCACALCNCLQLFIATNKIPLEFLRSSKRQTYLLEMKKIFKIRLSNTGIRYPATTDVRQNEYRYPMDPYDSYRHLCTCWAPALCHVVHWCWTSWWGQDQPGLTARILARWKVHRQRCIICKMKFKILIVLLCNL